MLPSNKPTQKFSVALQSDAYKKLINDTLGDKEVARRFVAEISTVVAQNYQLQQCDPATILSSGLMAQTLGLPLSPTLGFAYIIPYNSKNGLPRATFQIGYKGLIQLAQRSGQMVKCNVRCVHKGEWLGQDENGEDVFKWNHDLESEPVVGYYAYFVLANGFKQSLYWTTEQCKEHARKYSRSFSNGKGTDLWSDNFDFMAQKTVLKLLLNRYAPLSIELQKAVLADQSVIRSDGTFEYVDNEQEAKEQSGTNFEVPQVPTDKVEEEIVAPTSEDDLF